MSITEREHAVVHLQEVGVFSTAVAAHFLGLGLRAYQDRREEIRQAMLALLAPEVTGVYKTEALPTTVRP